MSNYFQILILLLKFKLFLFINRNSPQNERNIFNTTFIKIYGNNSDGEHFIDVYMGNSFQKQTLLIDITSYLTYFQCEDICKNCSKINNNYALYKLEKSAEILMCKDEKCSFLDSNYDECEEENSNCTYRITLQDQQQYEGIYIEDYFLFKNKIDEEQYNKTRMLFGCTLYDNLPILTFKANGVLGLASDMDSFIPNYLVMNNLTNTEGIFSLCYDNKEGGYFSLGYINTTFHDPFEEIKYFPYIDTNNNYQFSLVSMKLSTIIGDNLYEIKFERNIIAIITNDFYCSLPEDLFDLLRDIYNNYLSQYQSEIEIKEEPSTGLLYFETYQNIDTLSYTLPPIVMQIFISKVNNAKYTWEPLNYLSEKNDKIYLNIKKNNKKYITIGTSWMSDHEIIFNFNLKEIGFIKSSCNMISRDPCFKWKGKYLRKANIICLPIIGFLISLIIFLIIAINELRKENSFLCIESKKDMIFKINNEMIPTNYSLIQV